MASFVLCDAHEDLQSVDKFMFRKLFTQEQLKHAWFYITNCTNEQLLNDTLFQHARVIVQRAPDAPEMIYAVVIPNGVIG